MSDCWPQTGSRLAENSKKARPTKRYTIPHGAHRNRSAIRMTFARLPCSVPRHDDQDDRWNLHRQTNTKKARPRQGKVEPIAYSYKVSRSVPERARWLSFDNPPVVRRYHLAGCYRNNSRNTSFLTRMPHRMPNARDGKSGV